jgi:hypothetical protein
MIITSIIQGLAALYVFFVGVIALNKMDKQTAHAVRYAHIALVAGSAAGIASGFVARDIFECVFAVGIALYLAGNRRGRSMS